MCRGKENSQPCMLKTNQEKRKKYDWKNICFFQCASVEFSLAVLKTPRTTTHINGLTVSTCKCFSNLSELTRSLFFTSRNRIFSEGGAVSSSKN